MKKILIIIIALGIIMGICKLCNVHLTEEVRTVTSETVTWDMS